MVGKRTKEMDTKFYCLSETLPPNTKLTMIKAVRHATNVGLREAKQLIEFANIGLVTLTHTQAFAINSAIKDSQDFGSGVFGVGTRGNLPYLVATEVTDFSKNF